MTDRYTKGILTIIALCLIWLCVRGLPLIPEAKAAEVMDVRIVGIYVGDPEHPDTRSQRIMARRGAIMSLPVNVQNWPEPEKQTEEED